MLYMKLFVILSTKQKLKTNLSCNFLDSLESLLQKITDYICYADCSQFSLLMKGIR